ncbi:MAG: hypothetical protein E6R08_06350 [Nevskiaceae bacterium]|nr:MAG: hypothetical protein E6R08_06350 [Nevskiaceae bacterium]
MNIVLTRKSNSREVTVNSNHILYVEDSDTGNKGSYLWFNDHGQAMEVRESQDEIRHIIEAALADWVRRDEEVRIRVNTVKIDVSGTQAAGMAETLKNWGTRFHEGNVVREDTYPPVLNAGDQTLQAADFWDGARSLIEVCRAASLWWELSYHIGADGGSNQFTVNIEPHRGTNLMKGSAVGHLEMQLRWMREDRRHAQKARMRTPPGLTRKIIEEASGLGLDIIIDNFNEHRCAGEEPLKKRQVTGPSGHPTGVATESDETLRIRLLARWDQLRGELS